MPTLWTSVCISSSQSSMCEDATRISCGPPRVPDRYVVVRSRGIGRMTTRAFSKSAVVGLTPPNSPSVWCSYSNGRFIHVLEAVGRHGHAVDGHHSRRHGSEHRTFAVGKNPGGAGGERRREKGERDRRVRLDRYPRRIGRELAPALRFLEARSGGAAVARHVG